MAPKPLPNEEDEEYFDDYEEEGNKHDCFFPGPDWLQFGVKDLHLNGDFGNCASQLEFSYGIGIQRGSQDAQTLLAGAPRFVADDVVRHTPLRCGALIWTSSTPPGGFSPIPSELVDRGLAKIREIMEGVHVYK